jgi:hypothetical protein
VVGAVVAVIMVAASMGPGSSNDGDDLLLQQVDAERYCKAEVDARLKSPASAEYVGVSTTGTGPFTVTGRVDAANSFGSVLRSGFSCTVELVGGSWDLQRISVD